MNLEQAPIQLLFEQGILKSAVVVAVPMTEETYTVFFTKKDSEKVFCVKARSNTQREFKSLKSAANFVKTIGFNKFEVKL